VKYRFAIRNSRSRTDAHETLEQYKLASLGGRVKRGRWVEQSRDLGSTDVHVFNWPDSWVEIEMTFDQVRELLGRFDCFPKDRERWPRGLILNVERSGGAVVLSQDRSGDWLRRREWKGDERAEYSLTFYDDWIE